ncbi:MAG TPA: 2-hydroxyacyl-CoA dehydratase family protein [Verrucomicrobiae bacterium]
MVISNSHINTSAEVFVASPWIPAEWIRAHGLQPRAILFAPGFGAEVGPLGAGICAFAQNSLRAAETAAQPAVVFSTHCDQLRRAFDAIGPGAGTRTFLFNIPVTTRASVTEKLFHAELGRLGKFLLGLGGRNPTAKVVARWVDEFSVARRCLRDAANLHVGRDYARAVARFHGDGSAGLPLTDLPLERKVTGSTRLAVVGGPLSPDDPLWDQIEDAGGCVVLNGTEWGERSLGFGTGLHDAYETASAEAPFPATLSQSFVEHCVDVFQRPNQRLYDWLAERLRARRVQGIVLWSYFGCDLWRAEAQTMREKFGLPLLWLEADESGSGAERQTNRIQAFVEALT